MCMAQISEYGEFVKFSTKCSACTRPIGLGRTEDGEPIYVDDLGRSSCPDPLQDNMPFAHEPMNNVFTCDL